MEMYSVVTEIVAEILFVMALVTVQIRERKSSEFDLLGLPHSLTSKPAAQ
jgi:hypothetical protein